MSNAGTITLNAVLWMYGCERILVGSEMLALQGVGLMDLNDRNSRDLELTQYTRGVLAGEMYSQYSMCIYLTSLLSEIFL